MSYVLLMALALGATGEPIAPGNWSHYGSSLAGDRYAAHDEIDAGNVAQLASSWVYRTGDAAGPPEFERRSQFKATPIYVDGRLLVLTGFNRVHALDPATGKRLWHFDPQVDFTRGYSEMFTARGVSAGRTALQGPCATTVYFGTLDARLIALDAASGQPCAKFGRNGEVDLSRGIDHFRRGEYALTSPPTVVNDVVIVGSSIGDNGAVRLESGVIRAFDAVSGKLRWSFEPIPQRPQDPAAEHWQAEQIGRSGGANMWSTAAADPAMGLVFCRPPARRRTSLAARVLAIIATPIPWWRWIRPPVGFAGTSRPCTTICGTTIWPRSLR